jgi:hypothetical protein
MHQLYQLKSDRTKYESCAAKLRAFIVIHDRPNGRNYITLSMMCSRIHGSSCAVNSIDELDSEEETSSISRRLPIPACRNRLVAWPKPGSSDLVQPRERLGRQGVTRKCYTVGWDVSLLGYIIFYCPIPLDHSHYTYLILRQMMWALQSEVSEIDYCHIKYIFIQLPACSKYI